MFELLVPLTDLDWPLCHGTGASFEKNENKKFP